MQIIRRKALPLFAIPLIFQGCATSQDGRTTQAQSTLIGSVSGGALGFLAGSLLSDDSDSAAAGAVIGAAAGGAVGYAIGTDIAKRKQRYASTEAWLQQETAMTKQANDELLAYNQTLATEITALEKRVKKAREAESKAQIASIKNAVEKIRAAATKRATVEKQIALDTKNVVADSQAKTASTNYSAYKVEAARFDQACSERTALLDRLSSLAQTLNQ
jgi:membrane protein YqaA with SNARE-associated domain